MSLDYRIVSLCVRIFTTLCIASKIHIQKHRMNLVYWQSILRTALSTLCVCATFDATYKNLLLFERYLIWLFFSVAWHENSCTSWDVWRLYISLKIFRYLYIGNGFTFRIRRTNMNSASFRFHVIFTIYLSITQNDRKVLKIAKEIASMKD